MFTQWNHCVSEAWLGSVSTPRHPGDVFRQQLVIPLQCEFVVLQQIRVVFQPRFLTGWLAGCIHTFRFVIICKSTWRPVNTQKSGRIKDIYKGKKKKKALLTGSFHFSLRSNLHVSIILTFATESRALNEIRIQPTASAF